MIFIYAERVLIFYSFAAIMGYKIRNCAMVANETTNIHSQNKVATINPCVGNNNVQNSYHVHNKTPTKSYFYVFRAEKKSCTITADSSL